jgi:hypothetical protein
MSTFERIRESWTKSFQEKNFACQTKSNPTFGQVWQTKINPTQIQGTGWFHQTFSPSEKTPAHGVWQKIRRLISPTFYLKNLWLKIPENSPNAVRHSPVAIRQKRHRILRAKNYTMV